MIELKKISQTDFEKYKSIFIADESIELAENYKYSIEQSKVKAAKEFDKYFPNGKIQKNEFLLSINSNQINDNQTLGYLWYSISDDHVFILDFYIYDKYRGKGYGTQTISKLQKTCLKKNINQIRLRVAHNNPRALKLYQELGFSITGTNMMKWL